MLMRPRFHADAPCSTKHRLHVCACHLGAANLRQPEVIVDGSTVFCPAQKRAWSKMLWTMYTLGSEQTAIQIEVYLDSSSLITSRRSLSFITGTLPAA